MRRRVDAGKPIVLKVGSSSLVDATGGIAASAVEAIVAHVVALRASGHPTALVTSGAVAASLPALGLKSRPDDVPGLQVAAAVGQVRLMERYATAFDQHGVVAGQVLLTRDVLADRGQYLNARQALSRMIEIGVVPIVNENDTVVVDELKFGDNDRLAAVVSHLVDAGMLLILTDTPGLHMEDPNLVEDAALLSAVRHTDEVLDRVRADGGAGALGSGGAATKVAAARIAAFSGIPTVVASASEADAVARAVAGEEIGTWVDPGDRRLPARKLWIAFGVPASGRVVIDGGAREAVTERGRSLLAAGITAVEGSFSSREAVEVIDRKGALVAKGIVRVGSAELESVLGEHSSVVGGEAIHRDDLVVLI